MQLRFVLVVRFRSPGGVDNKTKGRGVAVERLNKVLAETLPHNLCWLFYL